MQTAGIDSAEFGPATVAAFIAAQGAAGRFSDWKAGSWAALLQYLRAIEVPLVDSPAPVVTAVDALLTRYAEYEATERGLATPSIKRNVRVLRPFVERRMRDGRRGLEQLSRWPQVGGHRRVLVPRRGDSTSSKVRYLPCGNTRAARYCARSRVRELRPTG